MGKVFQDALLTGKLFIPKEKKNIGSTIFMVDVAKILSTMFSKELGAKNIASRLSSQNERLSLIGATVAEKSHIRSVPAVNYPR